jgi:hypothetical protein
MPSPGYLSYCNTVDDTAWVPYLAGACIFVAPGVLLVGSDEVWHLGEVVLRLLGQRVPRDSLHNQQSICDKDTK